MAVTSSAGRSSSAGSGRSGRVSFGRLAFGSNDRDHLGVDGLFEREDVDAILSGVFDMNVALASIDSKLEALLQWLDIGGDDEEEEDDPLAPPDS